MTSRSQAHRRTVSLALLTASYLALSVPLATSAAQAQSAPSQAGASSLPPVTVTPPATQRRRSAPSTSRSTAAARGRRTQTARRIAPAAAAKPFAESQDARTGTSGYFANSTSVATRTNTAIVNIPQSLNVITREQIRDQNYQGLTDVTRYVPGVAVHQGEGNRDELVIRGVDSSANFFVNGFRDDVQYFRDMYNAQSIEVLRGPSALTFGRGAGGGLLNRTLKEADGNRVYEATAQTGSWGDRRVSLDAGQAINDNVAARLNVFYEGADAFRDFNHLERYGINPTVTLKPDDNTKIKLSYEYFHDERTADRGNPSQGLPGGATRFNPTTPFAPNGDFSTFFGSPSLNTAQATVQTGMAIIEHDFENGLTVRNGTMAADYQKFYQNVYPTGGPLAGAVNPADTAVNLGAYQHTTNRDNVFNQTDFTYKTWTGPLFHTVGFGTEFGRQTGVDIRNTGVFPNGTNTIVQNPFAPTYFGPVTFLHHFTGTNSDGVTTPDSNSRYALNIQSGYLRDTIEISRAVQIIAGARFDRYDMSATDMNTNINRNRVDNLVSPQGALIIKPIDSMSVYTAYSVSFLPASGDQFSALNDGTLILQPQRFENVELGMKWNINPKLLFSTAVYNLNRTNQPIADGNNPGFFFPSGSTLTRGVEASLTGYVTAQWQSSLAYAYTDAKITGATSATVVPGNRVQLVPYNQFAWWNKYQFTPMWAAALGVIYFGDSFASSDDTVRLPGFVRFDAAIYAKIDETWSAQLNIENIFDKGYWASADGNNNISPGQGRTVRLMARARF
ncbi:TonB-dependent siderophore receptor [Bradyrhizobium brasilense]|uniref:TonB-dependent receptor n=1 Tax=Bradyrhizobium brasilense TaxID=1419277 RepID=UPI0024B22266|nr:TonB-dependent siderophore receptor [Bradyrhizobium australafricanum]WFU35233.1 TonB-dependent siderophore receptor [Bradyrhizobium australafricanum]